MAMDIVLIQEAGDTKANWENADPILYENQICIQKEEKDGVTVVVPQRIKIGKGQKWSLTPYLDTNILSYLVQGTGITISYNTTTGQYTISGSASLPAQSAATTGKFLKSDGSAGSEYWSTTPPGFSGDYNDLTNKPTIPTYAGVETNADYTPADSSNTEGLFKGLLTSGKLKLKNALDRISGVLVDRIIFRISPDFNTSEEIPIKGLIANVSDDRTAADGSVPLSTSFVYSFRDSATSTWTTGQTLAQLKTRLTGHSSSTITWVMVTNTVTTVNSMVMLTLTRY